MDNRTDPGVWRTLMQRHRDERQSLQTQVRQMLVAAMLDRFLPQGSLLPSTRELAEALGISRNTVVLVYQQLVDDGYVTPRSTQGYMVGPQAQRAAAHRPPAAAAEPGRPAPAPKVANWDHHLHARPSTQRNIEKPARWQQYPFPFLYGQFDAAQFPTADWRQCCLRALNQLEVHEWGQDMFLRDDPSLIQQIRMRLLPRRGICAKESEVMLTVGAQHGLYLLADLLVGPGSAVGIEDPGYADARNIFAHRGASLRALPIDEDGLMMTRALGSCDLVYTTPSHQCPTTVTMTLPRRQALLELADLHDFIIVEDDYETENHPGSDGMPALKSLDNSGRVAYVGSLSKSLAPGLRTGYVVGAEPLIAELRAMRRLNIRHPNALIQRAVALFLGLGHHNALERRQAAVYAERASLLGQALQRHLPQCRFKPESHGSAFWVEGPRGLDARNLARVAETEGVLIEPGDVFFLDPPTPCRHFRMGFTSIASARIEEGVLRLGSALERASAASPE